MNDKLINALPHTALALLYLAGVLLFGLLLTGCSHNPARLQSEQG